MSNENNGTKNGADDQGRESEVIDQTMDLALPDDEPGVRRYESSAVAALNKSEVEAQLDAAHRHKRSIQRFMHEAIGLACANRYIAESCIYALPRDGKTIAGPSVRLAEICASAYGNLHVAGRVVGI